MQYIKIDPPKKKSDWPGTLLQIAAAAPSFSPNGQRWLPEEGAIVSIARRLNSKDTWGSGDDCSSWGEMRVLKCQCRCPHCGVFHAFFIPESWISEGKAHFVEALNA